MLCNLVCSKRAHDVDHVISLRFLAIRHCFHNSWQGIYYVSNAQIVVVNVKRPKKSYVHFCGWNRFKCHLYNLLGNCAISLNKSKTSHQMPTSRSVSSRAGTGKHVAGMWTYWKQCTTNMKKIFVHWKYFKKHLLQSWTLMRSKMFLKKLKNIALGLLHDNVQA